MVSEPWKYVCQYAYPYQHKSDRYKWASGCVWYSDTPASHSSSKRDKIPYLGHSEVSLASPSDLLSWTVNNLESQGEILEKISLVSAKQTGYYYHQYFSREMAKFLNKITFKFNKYFNPTRFSRSLVLELPTSRLRVHYLHGNILDLDLKLHLKFTSHYVNIKNKAFINLGFLLRYSKDFKSPKTIKSLYIAIVRPELEYCSPLWSPH